MSRASMLCLAVALTGAAASPALAAGEIPLFGPASFQRTAGPPNQYHDTFDVPAAMNAVVWIQNGDGEGGNRASSARVDIGGRAVAGPSDFNKHVDLVAKVIALPRGETSIDVQMNGEPGSTITVIVMQQGNRPDFSVGRLVLPGASSTGLTLTLKNGSRFPRRFKAVFFDADGNVVAWSEERELAARGSVTAPFGGFIDQGTFVSGSVEILWAGPGIGRLFGQATVHDDLTGVDAIVEMQHAGTKRIDPSDPNLKFAR